MAVAPRGASVPVGLVRVLVRIGVIFLHQGVVIPAVLGAGGQAVPALTSPLAVVIFIRGH